MKKTLEESVKYAVKTEWPRIYIDWTRELPEGTADRCTDMLIAGGYRPLYDAAPELQEAYKNGQKVNGKYVRLPQECWEKKKER